MGSVLLGHFEGLGFEYEPASCAMRACVLLFIKFTNNTNDVFILAHKEDESKQ